MVQLYLSSVFIGSFSDVTFLRRLPAQFLSLQTLFNHPRI